MRKAIVLTFCALLALSCADGNKGLEKGLREDLALSLIHISEPTRPY